MMKNIIQIFQCYQKDDFQALWPKNIFFCVDESPLELLYCGEMGLNLNTTVAPHRPLQRIVASY